MVFDTLKSVPILGLTKKVSPLDKIFLSLLPKSAKEKQREHMALTEAKLKRLESPNFRPDL
jgi:hypothetical protein